MKFLRKSGLLLLAVVFSCNMILSSEYTWYNPWSWRGTQPKAQVSQKPVSSSQYSWFNPRGYSYEDALNIGSLGLAGALGTGAYLYGLKDPQNYAVLPIMAVLLRQTGLGNITLDDLKKLDKDRLLELLTIIAYRL